MYANRATSSGPRTTLNINGSFLPFTAKLTTGFGAGKSLTIKGTPTHAKAWFAITFLEGLEMLTSKHDTPKSTAIFQIQPRFDENLIVLNTNLRGVWGKEERNPGFPLYNNRSNEITIISTLHYFEVRINGNFFATYNHRVDTGRINYMNFYGDFKIEEVVYK